MIGLIPAGLVQAQGKGSKGKSRPTVETQRGGQKRVPDQGRAKGTVIQEKLRVHTTDQQRDRLNTCITTADKVKQQTRDMTRDAKKAGYNREQAVRQRDQMEQQFKKMTHEHQQFREMLNAEQRLLLQERLRRLEQEQIRFQTHLQSMNRVLNQDKFDGQQVSTRAREMERTMNEWMKQYRAMSNDMGVKVP